MLKVLMIFHFLQAYSGLENLDALYDNYDGLELVEAIVKDEKFDLAQIVLKEFPYQVWSSLGGRIIQAKILAGTKQWEQFLFFSHNLKDAQIDELRIQAYFNRKQWKECISTDDHGLKSAVLLKLKCAINDQNLSLAYNLLTSHHQIPDLRKLKIDFLLEHGFIQSAKSILYSEFMFLNDADLLQILEKMKDLKLTKELLTAGQFIKTLRNNPDFIIYFSQICYKNRLFISAAESLSQVSLKQPQYSYPAAEIFRKISKIDRSEFMQFFIPEEREFILQKTALWLDRGKFGNISSLKRVVPRSVLRKDDELNYSLAYSLIKTGQFVEGKKFLERITRPEIISKAIALEQLLVSCLETKSICRL